jgi:sugar phosphate isomerase/epimerase
MSFSSTPAALVSEPMNRRDFLRKTAVGAAALSFPTPTSAPGTRMGIVVHSYASRWHSTATSAQYPGFANALDLLNHCHEIGAGGVQVTLGDWTSAFAKSVRDQREKLGLYLEGSVGLPRTAADVPRFEQEVVNAKEAGARVLRTVCSGGRRYETFHAATDFAQFRKNSVASLQWAEPVLRRHGVKLAVENHKDWRSGELVTLLKSLSSEWIGATIDFGNNLALLEESLPVVQALAPYALSTHVKDMAVQEYPDGFLLAEVPLGEGLLDLPKLVALCRASNPAVTFNLEMITRDPLEIPVLNPDYWATFADVPGSDLARTLRLVREHQPASPLPKISTLGTEDRLAAEERNIRACLAYSQNTLALK